MDFRSLDRFIEENIHRMGRSVIGVGANPPFSYSIGNHRNNLPELLLIGLAADDACMLINNWSAKMLAQGREFEDGELIDIGGRFPCKAIHCAQVAKLDYTIRATRFHGHFDYRVTQVIAPDPFGFFPDNPGCVPPYRNVPIIGGPNVADRKPVGG